QCKKLKSHRRFAAAHVNVRREANFLTSEEKIVEIVRADGRGRPSLQRERRWRYSVKKPGRGRPGDGSEQRVTFLHNLFLRQLLHEFLAHAGGAEELAEGVVIGDAREGVVTFCYKIRSRRPFLLLQIDIALLLLFCHGHEQL